MEYPDGTPAVCHPAMPEIAGEGLFISKLPKLQSTLLTQIEQITTDQICETLVQSVLSVCKKTLMIDASFDRLFLSRIKLAQRISAVPWSLRRVL